MVILQYRAHSLVQGMRFMPDWAVHPDEIIPMVPHLGQALVTLSIARDGQAVGIMERHSPGHAQDSGWVFYALEDSDAYLDNPKNATALDINIIANIDPSIIPFLSYPKGTIIERSGPDLPSEYRGPKRTPATSFMMPSWGHTQISQSWHIHLPDQFFRRMENQSLVLWREGVTMWCRNTLGQFTWTETLARPSAASPSQRHESRDQYDSSLGSIHPSARGKRTPMLAKLLCASDNLLICTVYFSESSFEPRAYEIATTVQPS